MKNKFESLDKCIEPMSYYVKKLQRLIHFSQKFKNVYYFK